MANLSYEPRYWDKALYKLIYMRPIGWDAPFSKFVAFIKTLSQNWNKTIPELLYDLERSVTFKLASLLHDIDFLKNSLMPEKNIDISSFGYRASHAFLPAAVYDLEEYGLPRMISRKIHNEKMIDFEAEDMSLDKSLILLKEIGPRKIKSISTMDDFDRYIVDYFYEGLNICA